MKPNSQIKPQTKVAVKNEGDKVWVTVSNAMRSSENESIRIEAGFSKTFSSKEEPEELIEAMIDSVSKIVVYKTKQMTKQVKKT
jgi:hypothetical protein